MDTVKRKEQNEPGPPARVTQKTQKKCLRPLGSFALLSPKSVKLFFQLLQRTYYTWRPKRRLMR